MNELILTTRPANGVVLVTLNRPEARNAFNEALLFALHEKLNELASCDETHVVVVTGGSTVFGAGGDLQDMSQASPTELWASPRHKYWNTIHDFPKPMIAAVNGAAYGGGCELALASDIVIAGDSARFALPEIKLGFIPGRGGTQRLPAIVNKSAAMHMILTGNPIDAQTALRLGLVWDVVPTETTIEAAVAIATVIAERPPVAVQIAKEMVASAAAPALKSGMAAERHCYEFLTGTDDAKEGMAAFLEKRPPTFRRKQ
jgi:enoyl-CoA hydratase